MITLETHVHTCYSHDSLTTPQTVVHQCRKKNIDRLIITDHNTIAGALIAEQLDPQRVIVGEEIMTTHGELLAFFVKEQIPPYLSPMETIQRLRIQEAFISVSHPFDELRHGAWQLEDLLAITPLVDAIEIFNSRCMFPRYNHAARSFANQHDLLGTVGSDAHTPFEIGRSLIRLPDFENASQFKEALPQAKYQLRLSSPLVHFFSRYATWRKKTKSKRYFQEFENSS